MSTKRCPVTTSSMNCPPTTSSVVAIIVSYLEAEWKDGTQDLCASFSEILKQSSEVFYGIPSTFGQGSLLIFVLSQHVEPAYQLIEQWQSQLAIQQKHLLVSKIEDPDTVALRLFESVLNRKCLFEHKAPEEVKAIVGAEECT